MAEILTNHFGGSWTNLFIGITPTPRVAILEEHTLQIGSIFLTEALFWLVQKLFACFLGLLCSTALVL